MLFLAKASATDTNFEKWTTCYTVKSHVLCVIYFLYFVCTAYSAFLVYNLDFPIIRGETERQCVLLGFFKIIFSIKSLEA